MEATLRQCFFYWPNMRADIERLVKRCPECQKYKKVRKEYGKLPAKEAEAPIPWNRVNVDLIGPLHVTTPSGKQYELNALTIIDPATGWFEVAPVTKRDSDTIAATFDDVWLARYPRPHYCGCDNGGENKGLFNSLLANYGLKKKATTTYNPQSNGIIERVHAVLNDMLRTGEVFNQELDPDRPWDELLGGCAYAIRNTYHTTLGASPAQLVFGRDMVLPLSFKTDWATIRERRQKEINRNNARENASRIDHTYKVNDRVLLKKPGILRKLDAPRDGPYPVTHVYNNGTVQIRRGHITERVNIRRIVPYIE